MSETFNILDTIKGRSYPTETAKVFLDERAVYELSKANAQLQELSDQGKTDEYTKLEKVAKKLAKQVEESSLVFHLQGVPPGVIDELHHRYDVDKTLTIKQFQDHLLAASLRKIVRHDGAVDERQFTVEDAEQFREYIPVTEISRVYDTINKVVTNTAIYESTISAGFLQMP